MNGIKFDLAWNDSECDRKYMFMYLGLVMEEYLGHMEGV